MSTGPGQEHSRLAKPQNAVRTEQSVSKDPDSSIDLEPYINPYRLLQDSNYVLVPNKWVEDCALVIGINSY